MVVFGLSEPCVTNSARAGPLARNWHHDAGSRASPLSTALVSFGGKRTKHGSLWWNLDPRREWSSCVQLCLTSEQGCVAPKPRGNHSRRVEHAPPRQQHGGVPSTVCTCQSKLRYPPTRSVIVGLGHTSGLVRRQPSHGRDTARLRLGSEQASTAVFSVRWIACCTSFAARSD